MSSLNPQTGRRKVRRRIAAVLAAVIILVLMSGLPRRAIAFLRLIAIAKLPAEVVGDYMGWEHDKVKYFRGYYAAGFEWARSGKSFGCGPSSLGQVNRPAVDAWGAGYRAGRDSGGTYAPKRSFERFAD